MTSLQTYMDKAVQVLDKYKIALHEGTESQMAAILQQVAAVDEPKVLAIAQTVKYEGTFNALVREHAGEMYVGTRYQDITDNFTSIREDLKMLAAQESDGKIDFSEKLQRLGMKLRRGTPHKRFEEIKKTYVDVAKDAADQIQREEEILGAYGDFRLAIKQTEILAYEVLEKQQAILTKSTADLEQKNAAVTAYQGNDAEKRRLEFTRDEARRAFDEENGKYNLLKKVAEQLSTGYNVGETVMLKFKQNHDLKKDVHETAVLFFGTNEHIFTAMDVTYTSLQGLHEQTQVLEATKDGINKGLEDLATMSGVIGEAAVKAAQGPTINASSVKVLFDHIVEFQLKQARLAKEQSELATKNTQEIGKIVEDGKQ